jgi:hypothetical protein
MDTIINLNKRSKGGWISVSLLLGFVLCATQTFAEQVTYTYDSLNRITKVDYGNRANKYLNFTKIQKGLRF